MITTTASLPSGLGTIRIGWRLDKCEPEKNKTKNHNNINNGLGAGSVDTVQSEREAPAVRATGGDPVPGGHEGGEQPYTSGECDVQILPGFEIL